jgi:hypothetical protein
MKTVQPHLLRSARSLRLLSSVSRSITFRRERDTFTSPRDFSVTARRKEDDPTMAPKGQKFELKTPKGTKDCKLFSNVLDHL